MTTKSLSLFSVVFILLSLALTGCGGANDSSTANPAQAAPSALKVAMLLPGPIDDKSWSQAGYEGLELIEKELGAPPVYTASVPEADMEKVFRQYAEEGYDFVIGHGGEFIPAAEVVAQDFPQTKFAVTAIHPGNNKNLGALSLRDSELGYLTGVVAALKTKTNKVAFIGGIAYPAIQEQADSFERGAKATNPNVEVSIEWVDSWTDEVKTKELAEAQIKAGADVLLADVDAAGRVVIDAAKNAGIYAIGWSQDQHEQAPDTVLTSGIQRLPVALLEGATLVQQGRWEGKQYKFGLQEGAQELAPFYNLLTPEEEAKVNATKQDILTSKIDVAP